MLFGRNGDLYGIGSSGGLYGSGTVFELSYSNGGVWSETVLHNFGLESSNDGMEPGGLVLDPEGNIFGVCTFGGTLGRGTLFELPHHNDGSWGPELIIHNFGQVGDGQNPAEGPTIDVGGNIYGTTLQGPGFIGGGTVYKVSPGPGGTWTACCYTAGWELPCRLHRPPGRSRTTADGILNPWSSRWCKDV